MSDLLAEVDEMMRQERMTKLWNDHGTSFIGIIAAIIIGTALISGYKSWNASQKEKDTAQLIALIESPEFPANINADALDVRPGIKGLGLISTAGALLAEDKSDEALKLLNEASTNKSIPDDIRGLASLSAARVEASQEEKPADLQARLEKIWSDKNSPWQYHARLEAAALLASTTQDYSAALSHLNIILDTPRLPSSLYDKAKALNHIYMIKQHEKKENS